MKRKACEACGYRGKLRAVVVHRIVPEEVAEQDGASDSGNALLCANCLTELYVWYSKKVSRQTYDPGTKQFRYRSQEEMVKEYEATYGAFTRYKSRLRRRG